MGKHIYIFWKIDYLLFSNVSRLKWHNFMICLKIQPSFSNLRSLPTYTAHLLQIINKLLSFMFCKILKNEKTIHAFWTLDTNLIFELKQALISIKTPNTCFYFYSSPITFTKHLCAWLTHLWKYNSFLFHSMHKVIVKKQYFLKQPPKIL